MGYPSDSEEEAVLRAIEAECLKQVEDACRPRSYLPAPMATPIPDEIFYALLLAPDSRADAAFRFETGAPPASIFEAHPRFFAETLFAPLPTGDIPPKIRKAIARRAEERAQDLGFLALAPRPVFAPFIEDHGPDPRAADLFRLKFDMRFAVALPGPGIFVRPLLAEDDEPSSRELMRWWDEGGGLTNIFRLIAEFEHEALARRAEDSWANEGGAP